MFEIRENGHDLVCISEGCDERTNRIETSKIVEKL